MFDEVPVPEEPVQRLAAPPPIIPEPEPVEPGLRLQMLTWGEAGLSGEAETSYVFGGRIRADGPIANTFHQPLRMFAALDISAEPGQQLSLASVETFGRSAELRAGMYLRLAESRPVGQHITTSLLAYGGFATMLNGQYLDRYRRSGGIGIRLAEEVGGSEIVVSWCRDESAGWIGPVGQLCVAGAVPIAGTNGALLLGGQAVLNLSRATVSQQRDTLTLWVAASVGDIVDAVRSR